jgi:hypothetical protein
MEEKQAVSAPCRQRTCSGKARETLVAQRAQHARRQTGRECECGGRYEASASGQCSLLE